MFYFSREFGGNSINGQRHQEQFDHVAAVRNAWNASQRQIMSIQNAAAIIPQDVYREFDNTTKTIIRANNQTLLGDLMPLAKSLPIGKIEHIYRQASDAGQVQVSLGGKPTDQLDKTDYDYDSSIKVIHQSGFGREWMEMEGQSSEGFDALIDDQANCVRAVYDSLVEHVYDGKDVSFKGVSAYGIKTSTKVQAVDLGSGALNINFATSTDPAAIRAKFIQVLDSIRITNNVTEDLTVYVSREIMSNFQTFFSTNDVGFGTILQVLKQLNGVADIKEDAQLVGNQMVGMVLDSRFIRPLIGMAVTTVPIQRVHPMANYNFLVWSNTGLEIRTDYTGKTGVFYARAIT